MALVPDSLGALRLENDPAVIVTLQTPRLKVSNRRVRRVNLLGEMLKKIASLQMYVCVLLLRFSLLLLPRVHEQEL